MASTSRSLTVRERAGAGTHRTPPHQGCLAGSARLRAVPAPPKRHEADVMRQGSPSRTPACPFPRWLTLWCARHRLRTGHWLQRGCCGVHTVAPSSMAAWFKSPGRAGSTSCWAKLLQGNVAEPETLWRHPSRSPHDPDILPEMLGDKGAAGIRTNGPDAA